MLASLRSALVVFAALGASSVAPAQVGPTAEPLIATTSSVVPTTIKPVTLDPLPAVITEEETPAADADLQPAREKDLPELVAELSSSDPGSRELECLAVGIYFESKGEPLAGQLAVGDVIANRAESGRFPSSYCGVLLQRGQFSFVHGRTLPSVPRASRAWKTAVAIAQIVDQDLRQSKAAGALFFHAKRVSPGWRRERVASIGNHIFYR